MALSAHWYPKLATPALDSLHLKINPAIEQLIMGWRNLEEIDLALIQVAYGLAPEPLTPDAFIRLTPYARPEVFIENMLASTERGWLLQENGKFWLTKAGSAVLTDILEHCECLWSNIETLPKAELEYLFNLLSQVVDKIKSLSAPPEKPAFELSIRFDRGKASPLLGRVRRRMLDLLAFRDDVHIAAWTPHEPEGQIWEAFTLIWRKQAKNAAELADQLAARNYDEVAYAAALEKLVVRGWLIQRSETYFIQPKAAQMRQEVEDLTNQLYDAAFSDLTLSEMVEFQALMVKFIQVVQYPTV